MTVLLAHNRYRIGGGEDSVYEAEANLLRNHGHKVIEVTEDNRDLDGLRQVSVAARVVWSRPAATRFRKLLHDHSPAVAHFHNTFPQFSPSIYYECRTANVPVVQTLHNYRLLCAGALLFRNGKVCEDCLRGHTQWPGFVHACYRSSIPQTAAVIAMTGVHRLLGTWRRQVDLYVALSSFAKRKFVEAGLPEEKITVKPNFVPFDPEPRTGIGRYAMYAGRLSREKGISVLMEAWKELPEIPLVIAGEGPLADQVLRVRSAQGDRARIDYVGRVARPELLALMKEARFLVFPTLCYENSPLAIAESFACGVPVIASRLGAAAEMVQDGRTGALFEPANAADLARKARWLWTDTDSANTLGGRARKVYITKYNAESNYHALMGIYQKVIKERQPGQ